MIPLQQEGWVCHSRSFILLKEEEFFIVIPKIFLVSIFISSPELNIFFI